MPADDRALLRGLLEAYGAGAFPMADPRTGRLDFVIPRRRAIIPLAPEAGFHVPRRLMRTVRQARFEITFDRAFSDVALACAAPRTPARGSESVSAETWIDERILHFYEVLFAHGHAHSVEAWRHDGAATPVLAGGLLGVCIGGFFAAETMFTRPDLGGTDAGKVCLVHLVRRLESCGFVLLDAQIANPHTRQFGVVEIPHRAYMQRLKAAMTHLANWGPFESPAQDGPAQEGPTRGRQARPPGACPS